MRRLSVALIVGLLAATLVVATMPGSLAQGNGERHFVAHLSGEAEVPPVETPASGHAAFRVNTDGSVDYALVVEDIANVTMAHIHLGAAGENGPVVVWLYPDVTPGPLPPGGGPIEGVIARGTFTEADFVGPLEGEPLSALVDAMSTGGAYVNVHTDDGEEPAGTGPGDFPPGEVRGQIFERGALPCPGNVTAHALEDGPVRLTWDAPDTPASVHFVVHRATGHGPFEEAFGTSGTEFLDEHTEAGVTYRYHVTTVDILGDEAMDCPVVEVTAIPFLPTLMGGVMAAVGGLAAYAAVRRRA